MRDDARTATLICLLALLAILLYPALFLGRVVAPEASLKGTPPWSLQWGPQPAPSPVALEAATRLGPRLQGLARDGLSIAVWNPWIGGGRPGWLSSPQEGGAPLTVLAGLLARPTWAWTALLALQIAAAFASTAWVLRRLGVNAWAACAGGLAYALSGAVASQVLSWQGSALALGPLALLPAVMRDRPWPGRAAAWGIVLALLLLSGPPGLQFVALGLAFEVLSAKRGTRARRATALVTGLTAAAMIVLPSGWLDRAGQEDPAVIVMVASATPGASLRGLVEPLPAPAHPSPTARQRGDRLEGRTGVEFLGAVVLLLAGLGLVLGRGHAKWVWVGTLAVAASLTLLPARAVAAASLDERPFGVVALAVAALAALGVAAIGERTSPRWGNSMAALACGLLLLRLVPPFAARVPFAEGGEARLATPLPVQSSGVDGRFVAILSAIPPDLGGTLAAPDARAADLRREPAYAALLGLRDDGELPLGRVLDPALPRLGVRWLVEPLPLRVVSGEVFSHVETVTAKVDEHGLAVSVPVGATRLGLPASVCGAAPALRQDGREWRLGVDDTLAPESDAWKWFALPDRATSGEAQVSGLSGPTSRIEAQVAWDVSGLRVAHEGQGARIWEWLHAAPFLFLADGATSPLAQASPRLLPGETVELGEVRPSRIQANVTATRPGVVVVQVKHRPHLWRAWVDGRPLATVAANGVWTSLPVGAGTHRVMLAATLPVGLVALALCATLGLAALALAGRRS